jgi:arginine exporter protein ArgO
MHILTQGILLLLYMHIQLGLQEKFVIHNSFDIRFDFSSNSDHSILVRIQII